MRKDDVNPILASKVIVLCLRVCIWANRAQTPSLKGCFYDALITGMHLVFMCAGLKTNLTPWLKFLLFISILILLQPMQRLPGQNKIENPACTLKYR